MTVAALRVITLAAMMSVFLMLCLSAATTSAFVANALVVPDPSKVVRDGVDGVVEQVKENAGGLVRDGVDGVVEQVKENAGGLLRADGNGGGILHDACYIHTGCNGGAGYCDWDCCNNNGGCWGGGPAWFCNDGGAIDASTVFDRCEIHRNCKYAQFNEVLRTWVCGHEGDGGLGITAAVTDAATDAVTDAATGAARTVGGFSAAAATDAIQSVGECYIHSGCNNGAGYCDSQCCNDNGCSMGEGWYCIDDQYVDDSTQFDRCLISANCGAAKYNDLLSAWVCDEGKFGF